MLEPHPFSVFVDDLLYRTKWLPSFLFVAIFSFACYFGPTVDRTTFYPLVIVWLNIMFFGTYHAWNSNVNRILEAKWPDGNRRFWAVDPKEINEMFVGFLEAIFGQVILAWGCYFIDSGETSAILCVAMGITVFLMSFWYLAKLLRISSKIMFVYTMPSKACEAVPATEAGKRTQKNKKKEQTSAENKTKDIVP